MTKIIKWNRVFYSILFVAIILIAATPAVSAAVTATISPNGGYVNSGDVITVTINAATNDVFIFNMTSGVQMIGNSVTSTIVMPFTFNTGTSLTTVTTTGITGVTTTVAASGGTTFYLNGDYGSSARNIDAGTYTVSIAGTPSTNPSIDYNVQGQVPSTVTSKILTFTIPDVPSGTFNIKVGDSTATSTATFTKQPPPVPTPQSSDGSPSGPSAPAAPAAPVGPVVQLAPPGVAPTSVNILHNPEGQVLAGYVVETDPAAGFSSSLDIGLGTTVVSATGQPVAEISVTPLDPTVAPDLAAAQGGVFSFSGLSVECEPSGTQFTGGSATISFSMTPTQWADALGKVNGNTAGMTISFYDAATKSWVDVPTTVDPVTHTVTAQVTHFSTYALIYKAATGVAATTTQTYGSMVTPTPVAAKTTVAPVIVKTMQAPSSTTKSPGFSGIAVIGVVGFVGLYAMRKKQ